MLTISDYPAAGVTGGNGNTATNTGLDQEDYSPPYRFKDDWETLYDANGQAGTTGFWFIDSEPALHSHDGAPQVRSGSSTGSVSHLLVAPHGKGADIGNHEISISLTGLNGIYNSTRYARSFNY